MQKITTCLLFNNEAEEAMNHYVSIFKNAKVLSVTHYGDAGPMPKGTVMLATFELDGQIFRALNAGYKVGFTEATSFMVNCETQEEIDELWDKLLAGGSEVQCGWLKDKFGVSWQIVPKILGEMVSGPNPVKAKNVMQAMFQMKKINIAGLKEAYERE